MKDGEYMELLSHEVFINEEKIIDRIEHIEEAIKNFPKSKFVRCWENELNYQNAILNREYDRIPELKSKL